MIETKIFFSEIAQAIFLVVYLISTIFSTPVIRDNSQKKRVFNHSLSFTYFFFSDKGIVEFYNSYIIVGPKSSLS